MKYLFLFGMYYKSVVKPTTVCSIVTHVYYEGVINGFQDYLRLEKKSLSANIMNMARSSARGFFLGITFPISIPLLILR